MRRLFLFMLALNGIFLLWQYFRPSTVDSLAHPLSPALERIQLMHESAGEEKDVHPASPALVRIECYTLGPFADGQLIEGLKQSMVSLVNSVSVRRIEERELHRYWIYLPAGSLAAAAEVSQSLKQKQIPDHYIVGKDSAARVSLGHFREKAYADRRMEHVRQQGFEPQMDLIYREYPNYWLDYVMDGAPSDQLDALIQPYLQNDVSRLTRDCEK